MVWAQKSSNSFDEHDSGDYGAVTFKFSNLAADVVVTEIDTGYGDEYERHEGAMQNSWIIFAPIAVWVARYLRWWSLWSIIHTLTMGVVGLLTIYSSISIYEENEFVYHGLQDEDKLRHSRIGMAIATLVIAELSLGACAFLFMFCGKSIYQMSVVRKAHKAVGYALLVACFYNVLIGRDLMSEGITF